MLRRDLPAQCNPIALGCATLSSTLDTGSNATNGLRILVLRRTLPALCNPIALGCATLSLTDK